MAELRTGEEPCQSLWARATAVCFDVDSTVCVDEGIDKLAEHCGVGEAVAAWTQRAMGGNVSFQEALQARLDIIRPSMAQIHALVAEGPRLTPGIVALVERLKARGVLVYLVTGGIRPLIEPVADALGLPHDCIFSNVLKHGPDGAYLDFDRTQPTSRSGGKQEVAQLLKQRPGHDILVVIGDGVTDMEARPPADLFVGFGGNVCRERVRDGCDWFVTRFEDLP